MALDIGRSTMLAKKDPWLVKRWEQVCRWESAKLESSDPKFSQMLEDWANQLEELKS